MIDFEDYSNEGSGPVVFAFASENDFRFEWGHFLKSIGVPHVLFRDTADRWYMKGIEGIGDVADTVAFIKSKSPNAVTLGLSKGGHGALHYAKLAGIREVIAISPVTVAGVDVYKDFEPHLHDRAHRYLPFHILDLKPLYASDPRPRVAHLCYSDGHGTEIDKRMVERLNYGRLWFFPGHDHGGRHNLATHLRDSGLLQKFLLT